MCNAVSHRSNAQAILDFTRATGLTIDHVPDYPVRYAIRPRQRAPILRLDQGQPVIEPGYWDFRLQQERRPPPYPRTDARAEGLATTYPWKLVANRQRCIVLADGFFEPEKVAGSKEKVPWSYYAHQDDRLFAMAGLWNEAFDGQTGEVVTTFAVITTEASPVIRIHDRMPAMIDPAAVREWLEADNLPAHLLGPYSGTDLSGSRVADAGRHSSARDSADLIAKGDGLEDAVPRTLSLFDTA